MLFGVRTKFWWCLAATALLIGGVIFANVSSVFALQNCTVEGPLAEQLKASGIDSLQYGRNVFWLDSDAYMEKLLSFDRVDNVRLNLNLPTGISADINQFTPDALVLTNEVYGLDKSCRILPYDSLWQTKNLPVFTGLPKVSMFSVPNDYRVAEVLGGLLTIREELPELFNQIAELDFSDKTYIKIYVTTSTETFLARSHEFDNQLYKLQAIMEVAASDANAIYNLSYDGVVIKQ